MTAPVASPASSTPMVAASTPSVEPPKEIDVQELQKQYFSTTDAAARVEIVDQLAGLDPVTAMPVIQHLFAVEKDADVRMGLLTSISAMNHQRATNQQFDLAVAALNRNQPKELRQVAIALLTDLGDPRAPQVLRSLANDSDEEVRTAATEAAESLRQSEGN